MVNHDRQQFSWDPIKNRINITKHGISFSKAAKIFDGPRLEREDTRRDYGETRIIALGRSERKNPSHCLYAAQFGHPNHYSKKGKQT